MPVYSRKNKAGGRVSARSRNVNVLLVVVTMCVMAGLMVSAFGVVLRRMSAEYAESYAASSAEALSAHIDREIVLMAKAARSSAVTEWVSDERDEAKRALAYAEFEDIVGELYSFNLYIGIDASRNQYQFRSEDTAASALGEPPIAVLNEANPDDAWYFNCLGSEKEYMLSVDIDHIMQRKRVWLDCKVERDGAVIGVISTGLEFSHVAGEIFSHSGNIRGLVVAGDGMVHIDSSMMDDRDLLYGVFEKPVRELLTDPGLLAALEPLLRPAGGGAAGQADAAAGQDAVGTQDAMDTWDAVGEPVSVALRTGEYRHMTVVPVRYTDWVIVILSGDSVFFDIALFIPLCAAALALLVAFAVATGAANHRLIFKPLAQLEQSLALMKANSGGGVSGSNRDDELGRLARSIQDLFSQANIDQLTGIYNRRFMENNLERMLSLMSRSGGRLSVLMLDIDHFKWYNDTYGHDQGDVCLRAVARALATTVQRIGDFAARYGGEEFVAVLPNTDGDGARRVAEKIIANVRALNIPHEKNEAAPYVTISIGATSGKVEFGQTWEDYIKRADGALYASKQDGRNRCTYAEFTAAEHTTV